MFITIKFLTSHIINIVLKNVVKPLFSINKIVHSILKKINLEEITYYARKR